MDRTTRIENDIARTRDELRMNVAELERKFRTALDWRHVYETNTAAFLGAAASIGALLALRGRHKQ